jgi:hypothetical protein
VLVGNNIRFEFKHSSLANAYDVIAILLEEAEEAVK